MRLQCACFPARIATRRFSQGSAVAGFPLGDLFRAGASTELEPAHLQGVAFDLMAERAAHTGTDMRNKSEYVHSAVRTVVYVYLYVFLEWLFFMTKPSFLGTHPWLVRIGALFTGVWPFLAAALILHASICILAWAADKLGRNALSGALLRVVPALVIASTALILVDNFTYTTFRWGIVKTTPYTATLYWILFLVIFIVALRHVSARTRLKPKIACALLGISALSLALSSMGSELGKPHYRLIHSGKPLPNIVFFASDGVNASHLSAYGYQRDTSPNLNEWLAQSLVAENAFTNSGMTTGSLTAMMTGKYPATNKVFYPPQTLTGESAYQHLPAVLRQLGYDSLQESLPYYGDAMSLNWLDSFNYANGRKLHWSETKNSSAVLQVSSQFARRIRDRLQGRIEQLLLIRHMTDDYAAVTSEEGATGLVVSDKERMNRVFNFIRNAHRPFFIHIHLMGTHCCKWHAKLKPFQVPATATQAEKDDAAFDNVILQSDRYFGQMMELLRKQRLVDNTLVIYSSDHIKGWDFRGQIPLIFIFPGGAHKGHITTTVQMIDVAPTVLDYLNMDIPSWMEGKSILRDDFSQYRPIFVSYRAQYLDKASHHAVIGPPTFDLAKDGLVICNRWYILSLADDKIASGSIPTYHGACDTSRLPDLTAAKMIITKHLSERGFRF